MKIKTYLKFTGSDGESKVFQDYEEAITHVFSLVQKNIEQIEKIKKKISRINVPCSECNGTGVAHFD